MNTFAQNIQAEDCLDAEQYAELQAYIDGSMQGLDFDPSQSDEPLPEFRSVFTPEKIRGFTDAQLFTMFNVVMPVEVAGVNKSRVTVERPIFKVGKVSEENKEAIRQSNASARLERVAALAAFYQNPEHKFFGEDGQALVELPNSKTGEFAYAGQISPFTDTAFETCDDDE